MSLTGNAGNPNLKVLRGKITDLNNIGLQLDDTLSVSGAAAEAKAVGDSLEYFRAAMIKMGDQIDDEAKCCVISLPDTFDFTVDHKDTNITEQVAGFAKTLMSDAASGVPVYVTGTDSTGTYKFRLVLDQVYHSAGVGLLMGLLLNPRDSTKVACFIVTVVSADYVCLEYRASVGTDESLAETVSKLTQPSTAVSIVRNGQTITITETLKDGSIFQTVLNLDENDWPISITANGSTVPVTWGGFDG